MRTHYSPGYSPRVAVVSLLLLALSSSLGWAQERLTVATTNGATNRQSRNPVLSEDGGRIAFWSDGDFLSEGRADNDFELWLWDATTGLTRLTDTRANGATNRDSEKPRITADGNRIAFWSDGDFLSEGRADNDFELWLWDDGVGFTRLTDTRANGALNRDVFDVVINPAGTIAAFVSDADFLNEGRADQDFDLWRWTGRRNLARLTDVTTNGASSRAAAQPAISANGMRIAFKADADFLSEGRADNDFELWLWDATTGLTRLTDTRANGATNRDVTDEAPVISDDGSRIAFVSDGDFLSEGRADQDFEVWLWDQTQGLIRITDATANGGMDRDSDDAWVSPDGQFVLFSSDADLLGEGLADDVKEIWLYDIGQDSFRRLTDSTSGTNITPAVADGSFVIFAGDFDFATGTPLTTFQFEIWRLALPIFADGFESGNTSAWSGTVP